MEKIKYLHSPSPESYKSAKKIVSFLVSKLNPRNVIDIGCGVGIFLKEFSKLGIKDVYGVDGSWLDFNLLTIDKSKILIADLENPLNINKKYDLALCLEVAEHLSIDAAPILVKSLISISDMILFSAALPKQGGFNHINEQWIDYWINYFKIHNYHFYDIIRPVFWNDKEIFWWYRQNTFLVIKEGVSHPFCQTPILQQIHPELYMTKVNQIEYYEDKVRTMDDKLKIFELFLDGECVLSDYLKVTGKAVKRKLCKFLRVK